VDVLQNPGSGPATALPDRRPRLRLSARERAERAGLAMVLLLALLWSLTFWALVVRP
jgi:hypothetical protein